jgi:hypothetical protein
MNDFDLSKKIVKHCSYDTEDDHGENWDMLKMDDVKEFILRQNKIISDLKKQLKNDFLAHKNMTPEFVMNFVNARIDSSIGDINALAGKDFFEVRESRIQELKQKISEEGKE